MHVHKNTEVKKNTFIMVAFFIGMIFSIVREEYEVALISGAFVIVFFIIGAVQKLPENSHSGTFIPGSVE
ncbi:MAG: hypothetical protein HYV28_14160 [Ignavibacteriales bacterium]|nr:hypothetical protein [Ignavibacteriales bacterium]